MQHFIHGLAIVILFAAIAAGIGFLLNAILSATT